MAIESPQADRESFARFGLVGLYVGIVPVALGLLWYPFLRRLGRGGMTFVLALTVGLLAFLVVDMWGEAQEMAPAAVGALDAPVLVPLLALLTAGLLVVIGHSLRRRATRAGSRAAAGAGLPDRHRHRAAQPGRGAGHRRRLRPRRGRPRRLPDRRLHPAQRHRGHRHRRAARAGPAASAALRRAGALAGGPAILGTWIGAFTYSPFWTTIFLAIGIGAILQVIVEVGRLISALRARPASRL